MYRKLGGNVVSSCGVVLGRRDSACACTVDLADLMCHTSRSCHVPYATSTPRGPSSQAAAGVAARACQHMPRIRDSLCSLA